MSGSNPVYSKLEYDSTLISKSEVRDSPEAQQRRNYDLCMVFKYKTSKNVKYEEQTRELLENRVLAEPTPQERHEMQMWKQQRESILKSLQNCGLHLFCFYSRDRDDIVVKIGAGAQKLRDTAARMKYKLQLKKQYLSAYAEYRHDFPGRPERNFKDRRAVAHIYQTHTEDDFPGSDAIFKTLDKINLIHHIITSKDKECAGIPVGNLMHSGDLKAYFPLHEVGHLKDLMGETWLQKFEWIRMPEEQANKVRDYFGDKIAFYFLFMAWYVKWLFPLAVIGLALQFIDVLARTPDNMTAIPFCILMAVWCTFLPYFWRRQEAKYAIGWGTLDLNDTLEPCRPQHSGEPRINPVTAQVEPYFPWEQRIWRFVQTGVALAAIGIVLILCLCGLMYMRHQMKNDVSLGIVTFQFAIAAFTELANHLLSMAAKMLTERENHRTQSDYEKHLLWKVMLLKFVNSYFVLFYIAFFKTHMPLFGVEMQCLHDDCFQDLQSQLGVFVFFRLTFSSLMEYAWPKLGQWFRSCWYDNKNILTYCHGGVALELADMSAAEQQARKEPYDYFSNFDDHLITHGYATLFAVTSPWVCAATFLGVVAEIFVDMRSLCEARQRPIPQRAKTNEPWSTAFDIYGALASSTNVVLLIFASHEYDGWTLTEKLCFFVYIEHMLIVARVVLKLVFPETPRNVELLQLKQDNMVHRCLENIKVQQNMDTSMFRENRAENIEVFEHDLLDDDEAEPTLHLAASATTMYQGIVEAVKNSSPSTS